MTVSSAVQRALLSGSTNGKAIAVAATSSPGTTIHTAGAGTTAIDEVWLWAYSTEASTARVLHLEWGESTAAKEIIVTIPASAGLFQVACGLPINNGLVIKAFCPTANVVNLIGHVNTITIAG